MKAWIWLFFLWLHAAVAESAITDEELEVWQDTDTTTHIWRLISSHDNTALKEWYGARVFVCVCFCVVLVLCCVCLCFVFFFLLVLFFLSPFVPPPPPLSLSLLFRSLCLFLLSPLSSVCVSVCVCVRLFAHVTMCYFWHAGL